MSDEPHVAVDVRNELGEGIIWHAGRQQLMWFDIFRKCAFLAGMDGSGLTAFGFSEHVSAAFIVDDTTILIASSIGLLSLDLTTGETAAVCEIEADRFDTRPNDCRAAPGNSIWIGTMSDSEQQAGSIYHFRDGEI